MNKVPIRTASPTLRELFEIMEREKVTQAALAKRAYTTPDQIYAYKVGNHMPGIMFVEEMGMALGYKIKWVPINDPS